MSTQWLTVLMSCPNRRHQRCVIAFLDDGPVCLVASSTLGEGPAVLHSQMQLVRGLLISLLTYSALQSVYTRSPGYDIRRLLSGINNMLECLVESFLASPAALLAAYETMPLAKNDRIVVLDVLKNALHVPGAICSIILSSGRVVGIASTMRHRFHYGDILLLSNFLISNASLKSAETMAPICLPNYNQDAHLQAYIHFFDAHTDSAVVLLSGTSSNEGIQAIKALRTVTETLQSHGIITKIITTTSMSPSFSRNAVPTSTLSLELRDLGFDNSELYHYAYKLTKHQQFITDAKLPGTISFSLQASTNAASLKTKLLILRQTCRGIRRMVFDESLVLLLQDIMIAYGQLRAAMFNEQTAEPSSVPVQSLRYELRSKFAVVGMASGDAELYIAMSTLSPKSVAVKAAGELARKLRTRHADCFF